ncbi:MAG: moderate conductance mechanosensitive channel [Actinomycetota bacterium]|jgi:small conductance mechanosensitive channel|nr:moderate conductance mechanosensitive channel [Actinomycetota bacterium]
MDCQTRDLVCKALHQLGLEGSAASTVESLIEGPFRIAFILIAAMVLCKIGSRLAVRGVTRLGRTTPLAEKSARAEQRAATLAGVAASTLRVAIWTVAILLIAGEVGLNLGPLLAGAGIVGLALAFGAQSLVKDFVSGFFILAEDQYGVGDLITVGAVQGNVEEVNLRVTTIRANDGTVWFVPNGDIRMVGNAAKDWAKAVVDIVVPKGADLALAIAAITNEVDTLAADEAWAEALTEKPQVLGVETMGTEGVTVRVEVKTAPGNRARVARELRTRIGARLYREGIASRQDWRVESPVPGSPDAAPSPPSPPEPPLPPLPLG